MKTTTLQLKHLVNRSHVRLAFLLISLACLAFSPQARAVCQQGCDSSLFNAFLGDDALISNTTGTGNTAVGWRSLFLGSAASFNTAVGAGALALNTADLNTAFGTAALLLNTSGVQNTAVGSEALLYNESGFLNTATGSVALLFNTIGADNTAIGANALEFNTTGASNTAIGTFTLEQNTIGNNNTALGSGAGTQITGDNNIDIGNGGEAADSGTIRIGNILNTATYIAGISGSIVPTGVAVIVDADGHLGTTTSSARFKEAIKPMDKASEAILALKPVTFRYKPDLDPKGIPQFGLVAEDVEKVNPNLVARDDNRKPYTVRYEAVNAMLLNEFLKEHKAFVEEQRKVQKQDATIARLEKQVEMLTAGLQKVSAQLELGTSPPQKVVNNR